MTKQITLKNTELFNIEEINQLLRLERNFYISLYSCLEQGKRILKY